MAKGQFKRFSSAQLGADEPTSPQLRFPKFLPVDRGGAPCRTTSYDQLHANACASASRGDGIVLSRPETGVADPHSFGTAASAETARQDCPPVRPADKTEEHCGRGRCCS